MYKYFVKKFRRVEEPQFEKFISQIRVGSITAIAFEKDFITVVYHAKQELVLIEEEKQEEQPKS